MTRFFFTLIFVLLCSCATTRQTTLPKLATADEVATAQKSVVWVRMTTQEYHFREPWKKQAPVTKSSHAVVVSGNKVLMPSLELASATYIEVKKPQDPRWYQAKVVVKDLEYGLALLSVDDVEFWRDLGPVKLSKEPQKAKSTRVWHWHTDNVIFEEATPIGFRAEAFGCSPFSLLSMELLSPFQTAGDGEPVTDSTGLAGIVMGRSGNTLLALASPAIRAFLDGADDSVYPGFGRVGLSVQTLTSPDARQYFRLSQDEGGVLVNHVKPNESGAEVIKEGDVLLKVAGLKVEGTGRIKHPLYGSLIFDAVWSLENHANDSVPVEVLRNGKRLSLDVKLKRKWLQDDRVPLCMLGVRPEYFVYDGFVFQTLSMSYISTFGGGRSSAPSRLLIEEYLGLQDDRPNDARIVILSHVLPTDTNIGYQDLRFLIVDTVNEKRVRNIAEVKEAIENNKKSFQTVHFSAGQAVSRAVLKTGMVSKVENKTAQRP